MSKSSYVPGTLDLGDGTMGDLANMTSVHGEVNGFRLLRWLRSRAQMEHDLAGDAQSRKQIDLVLVHMHMAVELGCMADDLESELTPPDYPEDARTTQLAWDGENNAEEWADAARARLAAFPAATHPLILGAERVEVTPGEADEFLALARTLPGWVTGPAYARKAIIRQDDVYPVADHPDDDGDTVDLDDPALKGGDESP